ncbi:hypothetical protein PSAC2689_180061 [Paraburkholderia sacchari]
MEVRGLIADDVSEIYESSMMHGADTGARARVCALAPRKSTRRR